MQAAGNRAIASLLAPTPVQRDVPTGPTGVTGPSGAGADGSRDVRPTLSRGSTGDDVRTVQSVLVARGSPVSIDGQLGTETAAYVCLLQHRWHIDVTGTVDRDTWAAVDAELDTSGDQEAGSTQVVKEAAAWGGGAGPSTEMATAAATVAALENGPAVQREEAGNAAADPGAERRASSAATIGPGSTGPDVMVIQAGLQIAFPAAGIAWDGVFGDATEAHVLLYQLRHGLVPDGIVGPETRSRLDPTLSMQRHAAASEELVSLLSDFDAMTDLERAAAFPEVMPKIAAAARTLVERDF